MLTEEQLLTKEQLLTVVRHAPLVSIDLVVRNAEGQLLLGLRRNEPAQDYWFVPGGRIAKGESLDDAFARITLAELGSSLPRAQARLLGPFTHIYSTNFAKEPGVGTHYVVLAYEVDSRALPAQLPHKQHSDYRWWFNAEAALSDRVHPNNLAYFLMEPPSIVRPEAGFIAQYAALNDRRNSFNQLLWQAPALSITAQAFLFTIIFGKDVSLEAQMASAGLALVTALASLHLLWKHRLGEVDMARRLTEMEHSAHLRDFNATPKGPWYESSYRVWQALLSGFGLVAAFVIVWRLRCGT
jgi:colanic acid biosynthesis protein WcaH